MVTKQNSNFQSRLENEIKSFIVASDLDQNISITQFPASIASFHPALFQNIGDNVASSEGCECSRDSQSNSQKNGR